MGKIKYDYSKLWLAFVNIKAKDGFEFCSLIDNEGSNLNVKYKGAWANIIVKGNEINEVLNIIPLGLAELQFEVIFIDKVENMQSLIEYKEVNSDVLIESNWLMKNTFVFKISDKLFPYE